MGSPEAGCSHEWTLEPKPGIAECALCGDRLSREVQRHEKFEQIASILHTPDSAEEPSE